MIERLIDNISKDNPYSYYTLGVGNIKKPNTVNHYVSLFAYKDNDTYKIFYFNPLPNNHYNEYSKLTKEAIDKYSEEHHTAIEFINHGVEKIQEDTLHCAELSCLYLYLSTLALRVKLDDFQHNEHDRFF